MRRRCCAAFPRTEPSRLATLFFKIVYSPPMRSVFHTLLIWLMLLAVPVQGFAAASMLLCEPIVVSNAASANAHAHHHDHAQMSADHASADQLSGNSNHAHHHQQTSNHHTAAKCGACAACCIAVAMTAPAAAALPHMHVDSERITALNTFPSSVIPVYPDRPPKASFV